MDRFSAHMDRAWELVVSGKTGQALVAARKALAVDRESPEVHNLLGYIHALDGDLEEALANYQQAMELDDCYIDPILNTAEALSHPDADPEEAIRLCRVAAEMVSGPEELVETILLEVEALLNLGRRAEAIVRLGEIERPEALPVAYMALIGRAYCEADDPITAKEFINRAVLEDPNNADALYYQGLIARDEGLRIEAVKAFLRVLARDTAEPMPAWAQQLEPFYTLVRRAVAALPEDLQAMLKGTQIVVVDYPTEQQVRHEVDPRQVVLLEGVDATAWIFEKMWIFRGNVIRGGTQPATVERDLARLIQRELTCGSFGI